MSEETKTTSKKRLQLARNANICKSRVEALSMLKSRFNDTETGFLKGEPALAIYSEEGVEKVILAIKGISRGVIFEGVEVNADGTLKNPEYVEAILETIEALKGKVATAEGAIQTLNGDDTTDGSVAKSISDALANLKNEDAAADGEFVTEVKEENGIVTVKRKAVAADKVSATPITASDDKVAVAGNNVAAQIASLAGTLKGVQNNAAKYEVVKLDDTEIQALTDDDKANIKEAYKVISYTGDFETATDKTQVGATIKIYKDGNLKDAKLGTGEDAQKLILTYIKADGQEDTVKVDFAAIAFNTEFKDGLIVDANGEVKVKLADGNESFLEVGTSGLKLSGVQDAIDDAVGDAVAGLDAEITSTDGAKVEVKVTEVDGKITKVEVTETDIASANDVTTLKGADTVTGSVKHSVKTLAPAAPLTGYTKADAESAIAATDTIAGAIGKLEKSVEAAKTSASSAATTALQGLKLNEVGGNGKFVKTISQTNGQVAATAAEITGAEVVLDAIADNGKTLENAETVQAGMVALFKEMLKDEAFVTAIKTALGVNADGSYAASAASPIISTATSFKNADEKLAAAVKELQDIDVIDCGTY